MLPEMKYQSRLSTFSALLLFLTLSSSLLATGLYPVVTGETGVTDTNYIYGDLRRFLNSSQPDNVVIQNACDSMGALGGGTVYIPAGVYLIETGIHLDASHNGITIRGDGAASELRAQASTDSGFDAIIYLRDNTDQIRDIAVEKLGLNGNRDYFTANSITFSKRNLWFDSYASIPAINVRVSDVDSFNATLAGISVGCATGKVENLNIWDCTSNGLNILTKQTTEATMPSIIVQNIHVTNCNTGIDISNGGLVTEDPTLITTSMDGFHVDSCAYGVKVSCYGIVNISNGVIQNSTLGNGMYSQDDIQVLNLTNVITRNNYSNGFYFPDKGVYNISNCHSYNDVTGFYFGGSETERVNINATNISAITPSFRGIILTANTQLKANVTNYLIEGAGDLYAIVNKSKQSVFNSGRIAVANGNYAFRCEAPTVVRSLIIEKASGATTIHGFHHVGNTRALFDDVDGTAVNGTKNLNPPANTVYANCTNFP